MTEEQHELYKEYQRKYSAWYRHERKKTGENLIKGKGIFNKQLSELTPQQCAQRRLYKQAYDKAHAEQVAIKNYKKEYKENMKYF